MSIFATPLMKYDTFHQDPQERESKNGCQKMPPQKRGCVFAAAFFGIHFLLCYFIYLFIYRIYIIIYLSIYAMGRDSKNGCQKMPPQKRGGVFAAAFVGIHFLPLFYLSIYLLIQNPDQYR